MAELLALSEGNVGVIAHRAMKALRLTLGEPVAARHEALIAAPGCRGATRVAALAAMALGTPAPLSPVWS